MGDLVEKRLTRERPDRADRDLSAPLRVTLSVAVQVLTANPEGPASAVSPNWLDSVAPTFRSAGAGLKAGATSSGVASYFVDTTLGGKAEPRRAASAQASFPVHRARARKGVRKGA
jgi:hypothetical protein